MEWEVGCGSAWPYASNPGRCRLYRASMLCEVTRVSGGVGQRRRRGGGVWSGGTSLPVVNGLVFLVSNMEADTPPAQCRPFSWIEHFSGSVYFGRQEQRRLAAA